MRIAPAQETHDGNRFNQVLAADPAREWREIVVAFCRDCVICRNSVMHSPAYVVDIAQKQGLSSGSRIATL